jgi:hypothetical protein
MSQDVALWLLQRRYDDIGINFRVLWDLYLKFYTVFLTFNIAALAWFSDKRVVGHARWLVASAFILQCLFTAVTSAKIALHSARVARQLSTVASELQRLAAANDENLDPATGIETSLPLDFSRYGGWVNCVAMSFMAMVWLALAMIVPSSVAR